MADADRLRSPFDHIFNIIGKRHEESLKSALYTTTTLIFASVGCAAAVAVYFILEPFFKPLLWAVLMGSMLHPFKHDLTLSVRSWLSQLHSSGTPLLLGTLFLPVMVVDYSAEWLGQKLMNHLKLIGAIFAATLVSYVIFQYFPFNLIVTFSSSLLIWVDSLLDSLAAILVTSLMAGIVGIFLSRDLLTTKTVLRFVSYFSWTLIAAIIINQTGPLKCLFTFLALAAATTGYLIESGVVKNLNSRNVRDSSTGTDVAVQVGSPSTVDKPAVLEAQSDLKQENSGNPVVEETVKVVATPLKPKVDLIKPSSTTQKASSNRYIYSTLWACAVILLWRHMWLLHLFPIPLVYFFVKSLGSYLGLWKFLSFKAQSIFAVLSLWLKRNEDLFMPSPVKYVFLAGSQLDKMIIERLEKQVDVVVSGVIIIVVVMLTILGSLFVGVQIYAESVHLVRFTTDLANQTISSYPEAKQWMPQAFNQVVDSVVDNAYLYGRTGIVTLVRGAIQEKDPVRAAQMEQGILDIIDRIQAAWATSGSWKNLKNDSRSTTTSIQTVFDGLKKTPVFVVENSTQTDVKRKAPLLRRLSQELLNVSALVTFARENIGMLMSILESIWTILIGNFKLLSNGATAILSLVFGGGTAILNFVVNRVIFLTALYYLLVASGPQYKPVQLASLLSPGAGTTLGNAVEDAINTVFLASFKKAAFYGLWTWLIHTIFQVNFVFIPSALAAVLGAAPFLGTYWAAIPAALELWLAQDRGIEAVLLMLCHFVPIFIVDDAFYAEIKGGGHPYLTGLAVAGGIFWLGLEGAIIGPLLLCTLLVAVTVYSSLMREPSVVEINTRWSQRRLHRTDTVG